MSVLPLSIPPAELIILVGFLHHENGRAYANHYKCGEDLVLDAPNQGVGMRLRLVHSAPNELGVGV